MGNPLSDYVIILPKSHLIRHIDKIEIDCYISAQRRTSEQNG